MTAPFIRGLSYNGRKGAVVHRADESVVPKTPMPGAESLLPLEVEGEDIREVLPNAYRNYCEINGCFPPVVHWRGHEVYFCGQSYDTAVEIEKQFISNGCISRENSEKWNSAAPDGAQPEKSGRDKVVDGRISLVTGGAQGFGESIVRELVSAGSLVWVADLNVDGAAELCTELNRNAGCTVSLPVSVNVTDEDAVEAMVSHIVAECGGIDLLISNAGVLKAGSVKDLALNDFEFVTKVNYTGFFLCTKHVSRVMAAQNMPSGLYYTDIIQINSKSGLEGSNKNAAYAGGKFGGIGLTQSFAMELVEDNIKVNAVCPGNFFDGPLWSDPDRGLFVQYLNTGKVPGAKSVEDVKRFYEAKVPMKRGCTGADVVAAIYYIIDQKYETGQAVPVTGGQVMLSS
ncbi:MAG: SDR family NAD(P)-dependent oxidoreductase [Spirochaetales bacterium]|nr:SDR family NAD(P)-dependent oxidoreductase [Spirochaetales bacterium]